MRLRTHEFLSRRGKEPKAAGGRRGFHAARRPPDPPLTKSLCRWSLAGAPRTGFPIGFARTAPLKTFRFQRGPVLRGGKSQRVRDALCAWHSFGGAGTKKPPLKGEVPAKRAEGFRLPRRKVAAALSAAVTTTPKIRKRARVSWAHKPEGKRKPIPSRSSGEGVWGRGASLREAASPPAFLTPPSPLRPLHAMRRRRRRRCTSGRRLGRGSGQG